MSKLVIAVQSSRTSYDRYNLAHCCPLPICMNAGHSQESISVLNLESKMAPRSGRCDCHPLESYHDLNGLHPIIEENIVSFGSFVTAVHKNQINYQSVAMSISASGIVLNTIMGSVELSG